MARPPFVNLRSKNLLTMERASSAESLIAGFTSYVNAGDLVTDSSAGAPAVTPATPWIIASSLPCGGAVSTIGGSAIGTTFLAGC